MLGRELRRERSGPSAHNGAVAQNSLTRGVQTMLPDRRVHTTLPTSDPERLRTFYEATLGFVPFVERPGAILYRAGDGSLFAISKAGARPTGGHTQMAFTVPDIVAEVAELRAAAAWSSRSTRRPRPSRESDGSAPAGRPGSRTPMAT